MGEVDQHAEAVHLPHYLAAEGREPAVRGPVGSRVGPRRVAPVGQGHVANTDIVDLSQYAEDDSMECPPSAPSNDATLPAPWIRSMSSAVKASSRSSA